MKTEQLDFPFLEELPALQVRNAPKKGRGKGAVTKVVAQAAADSNMEDLAQRLEADPDFRVLRRLKPCLDWPTSGSGKIKRVAVLDTETTGLDSSRDKIIELAFLCVDVDCESGLPVGKVEVYDGLEDPHMPIPKEVQEITGITPDMVRGQHIDDAKVLEMLSEVELVIAHNAGFDRSFAEKRFGLFAELPWGCSIVDVPWKANGYRSSGLENLARDMGFFYDAHRAEMDCHALLSVLASTLPKSGKTALHGLLQRIDQPSYRVYATNSPFDSKDLLKIRGYRWNSDLKVWHTRVDDDKELEAESAWLKSNVYAARDVTIQLEKLDAWSRYSGRSGEQISHRL